MRANRIAPLAVTAFVLAVLALLVSPALAHAEPAAAHLTFEQQTSCVTINGPTNVYAETSCVTPTWTVSHCKCPFGTTPSYAWTVNGAPVGSGPSLTLTYCPQQPATTFNITIGVTVRCSGQVIGSDTHGAFVSLCDDSTSPPTCNG